ncbi:MAG: hypothetical protein M3Z98_06230 [Candidatus Dormibacteraeota bacterium]|nr:hypothetical protein [Candidatus Dormibacteraeota bacterium]
MYMVIRRYAIQPGKVDEVVRKVDEQYLEKLRIIPGYEGYYVIDSGDGKITSITLSADEDVAKETNRLSKEWVDTWLQDVHLDLVETLEGRVVVHGGS